MCSMHATYERKGISIGKPRYPGDVGGNECKCGPYYVWFVESKAEAGTEKVLIKLASRRHLFKVLQMWYHSFTSSLAEQ